MRDGLVAGAQFTLGSLVTGCRKSGALYPGKWLHGFVIKTGTLLHMYVKGGNTIDACYYICLSLLIFSQKLKAVQQILDLSTQTDAITAESKQRRKIKTKSEVSDNELKSFHDSSISKAADMAAGFTSSLTGQPANDIIEGELL
ncbi:hypothetical protein Nepgr_023311 [Nepenthes gracilis]|uniref:DUF7798 domain-containing protein n=1 Tax=Nepenthes gracilis TaxID=150966 RepID=A0AAD3T2T7_NEPGR|nr:hypothetical protein Nepgr_023311 [Nepenthes gracilis]